MDKDLPKCYLGCCNVRSWTLVVSIINIVYPILEIVVYMALFTASPWYELIIIILKNSAFVWISISLGISVLKRNISKIRLNLSVYSFLFVLSIIMWISWTIISVMNYQVFDYKNNTIQFEVISRGFMVLWFCAIGYPVCQYYVFEKTRLKRNVKPEHQTV